MLQGCKPQQIRILEGNPAASREIPKVSSGSSGEEKDLLHFSLRGGRGGEINLRAMFIFYVLIRKYLSEESLCGLFVW